MSLVFLEQSRFAVPIVNKLQFLKRYIYMQHIMINQFHYSPVLLNYRDFWIDWSSRSIYRLRPIAVKDRSLHYDLEIPILLFAEN